MGAAMEGLARNVPAPTALWLENRPNLVEGFAGALERKTSHPIRVKIAPSVGAAEDMISQHEPAAYILDIKLDDRIDGVTFAKRIRRRERAVPINIVTSFLGEYDERIDRLQNCGSVYDRLEFEEEQFSEFAGTLERQAYAFAIFKQQKIDQMGWKEFIEHPYARELAKIHWRLFSRFAIDVMKRRGWAWVAICGRQAVRGSAKITTFPDLKTKERWAGQYGRVPFVYAREIVSEETARRDVTLLNHYPKIGLNVEGAKAVGDLDTGTNQTLISDELRAAEPASVFAEDTHFNELFEYCVNSVWLSFGVAGSGREQVGPIKMPVAIVSDWKRSPWVKLNPNRGGLVGRDLFATRGMEVRIKSTSDLAGVETEIAERRKK